MLVLGIETSCDETGIALYDTERGLLSHTLYSQVAMHREYGGVVPELASRDHIRRVLPLITQALATANCELRQVDGIAYTQGPGLAGALLVGASIGAAMSVALSISAIGIHHLEGHLCHRCYRNRRPFSVHRIAGVRRSTQLMQVNAVSHYRLLSETVDDAAGEAFDKTAKLLIGLSGWCGIIAACPARTARHKLRAPCSTAAI